MLLDQYGKEIKSLPPYTKEEMKLLVDEEVRKAIAAMPSMVDYDPDNQGYRRLSGMGGTRDLIPLQQDKMFELAYFLWDLLGTFKRLASFTDSFIFSDPIEIRCENGRVQEKVDKFWSSYERDMNIIFPDRCLWMSILGEQCWPVQINEYNGEVSLVYIDPYDIQDVLISRIDKSLAGKVVIKDITNNKETVTLDIIRKNIDPAEKKKFGKLTGDCFFCPLNNPPNSPRGRSDFRTLFDWIEIWEEHQYRMLERANVLSNFIWDVVIDGSDETVKKFKQEWSTPPEPNSVRFHNKSVEWKAVAPQVNSIDSKTIGDSGKSMIMGMAGRPDSWFGEGGKVYQSEADLMGLVPIKDMKKRQRLHKNQLSFVIKFVIDQAIIYGALPPDIDTSFKIIMPDLNKKDMTKIAAIIPPITTSVIAATSEGLITKKTASKTIVMTLNEMGQTIDSEDEFNKAQVEGKEKEDKDLMQDYVNYARIKKQQENKETGNGNGDKTINSLQREIMGV